MRYLLIPVVALSMTTATVAFAATADQTPGTVTHKAAKDHTATAETCTKLETQFDQALGTQKAKPASLKKAKVQREKAATYCKKNEPAKGVAMLRSALAKLGQKPQA